jgi:hypothetical protein
MLVAALVDFALVDTFKLLPLPQPHLRTRTHAQTCQSTQRATQLRGVLARANSVSIQNLKTFSTMTVP